jgi:dTDP-4-amino-4,6-dideoxygalactose transaminase
MNTELAAAALAADGGVPVRKEQFPPWPHFADEEISAVVGVLQSGRVNYWTGEQGRNFEREFAQFVGTKYAVAVANGTVALELALYSLGIGPGDEVITTSRTFVASASCILMRGAVPIFADVDRNSQNLTAETIRELITSRTKAVIVVHLAGWPCEMDQILALAQHHGLKVIEDCAQAHGAAYRGKLVGSIGDIGAYSFCQDKIITTGGEGGMLVTNHEDLWLRAWSFKDHGKNYARTHQPSSSLGFKWVHDSWGTNWRLTEMQSASGRVSLRRLEEWVEIRRHYAAVLTEHFSQISALRVTVPLPHLRHSYYKYYVFIRPEALRSGWQRDRILQAINAEGIPCLAGSCPEIYLERAFHCQMRPSHRHPVAAELGETSLMFLVHPTLTECDIADTLAAVEKVFAVASR